MKYAWIPWEGETEEDTDMLELHVDDRLPRMIPNSVAKTDENKDYKPPALQRAVELFPGVEGVYSNERYHLVVIKGKLFPWGPIKDHVIASVAQYFVIPFASLIEVDVKSGEPKSKAPIGVKLL